MMHYDDKMIQSKKKKKKQIVYIMHGVVLMAEI